MKPSHTKPASHYRSGDWIVYRAQKHGACPGPRARNIYATPRGEEYLYEVDKYWVVKQPQADGSLLVETRTGKVHRLRADDPHLRKASWWERLWHADRFPRSAASVAAASTS